MAVTLNEPNDLTLDAIRRVAFEAEPVELTDAALQCIEDGRKRFESLIENGVPCYGVTTGLGKLVASDLDAEARADLPRNILRARAAATGEPLPREVSRAMMLLKLGNMLGGADGVSAALAQFLVARLNDGFTPWVPSLGHGMAADATAHTHCFQTFIGEGFVWADDDTRRPASDALAERGIAPFNPGQKEGLALLNGIAAAPAYAFFAHQVVTNRLIMANATAALTIDAMAAPKDAVDPELLAVSPEPGTKAVLRTLNNWLSDSSITVVKLQAPISSRIVPQVHGALHDSVDALALAIARQASAFSDNPYMTSDGRFLSVGVFHNQHLVNAIEAVTLALVHTGSLCERRLHRLMDPAATGLNPQLAARPGLDAGLVVLHKSTIEYAARLRLLATPISILTSETSAGQEDYMSMAVPATARLIEAAELTRILCACEMIAAAVAVDMRGETPGRGVSALHGWIRSVIPSLDRDRSPGPDVELLLESMDDPAFVALLARYSHEQDS